MVIVAGTPGCGLNLDYLQCGTKCEDANSSTLSNGGGTDGSSGSDSIGAVADATTENAETSSSDDGGPAVVDDVSEVDASSDSPSDAFVALGDVVVMCGGFNCTGNHACIAMGTRCCSLAGADCDQGCCGMLACNASQKCVENCMLAGDSCTTASQCCSGTYCGSNGTCMTCLPAGAACSMGQCCGFCMPSEAGSSTGICSRGGGN